MAQRLASVTGRTFDVAIIGGGISGASAAQHLAAAGYTVVLVDKGDFASGATSRSSRILHSGLRYLAPPKSVTDFLRRPGAFAAGLRTARASSQIGDEFVRDTPDVVRRTRLLIPLFETSPFRGWQIDLGAAFLKVVAGRKVPLNYQRLSLPAAAALPYVSWLRTDVRLHSVVGIDDHQFVAPERLTIDCVLAAERLGAITLNFVAATEIRRDGDLWQVNLRSREGETGEVGARVLLNLAGVWVDGINRAAAGNKPVARKIVGVKGVSFALQLPPECEGVGIAGTNAEGDAIMCVPWGKLHYVGPTETVYDGDIEDVRPETRDIDHLLHDIRELMPKAPIERSRILYAWAGVRPITYDPGRAKGQRMPFSVIHRLEDEGLPNMLTMTWAAVMFHRRAARALVGEVERLLPRASAARPVAVAPPSPSESYPQRGPLVAARPDVDESDVIRAVREEHARDLVGVLYRRTSLGWNAAIPPEALARAAAIAAQELGWDEAETKRQIAAFETYRQTYHLAQTTGWSA